MTWSGVNYCIKMVHWSFKWHIFTWSHKTILSYYQCTSSWPLCAAWCRGVLPDLSETSRLHKCGIRASALPVAQFAAAMCNGVCQKLSRVSTSALCFSSSSTALWEKNTQFKKYQCQKWWSVDYYFLRNYMIFKCFSSTFWKQEHTSFREATARCRGVSKPWSLVLILAPVTERKAVMLCCLWRVLVLLYMTHCSITGNYWISCKKYTRVYSRNR